MKSNSGDSFFYVLSEKVGDSILNEYFKVGIVTHAKTDEAIKDWEKYKNQGHPVSIIRRISKLNNGNPREIIPIAYFKFDSVKNSRKIESKWINLLKGKNIAEKSVSREWFRVEKDVILDLIEDVIANKELVFEYWSYFDVKN
jgi:hypothetical protein